MEPYTHEILSYGIEGESFRRLVEIGRVAQREVLEIIDEPDLVALPAEAVIIDSDKLSSPGCSLINEYYADAGDDAEELVVWFGSRPFKGNNRKHKVCQDIETALKTVEKAFHE